MAPVEIVYVADPAEGTGASQGDAPATIPEGGLIAIDTLSLQPILVRRMAAGDSPIATLTTHRGSRYHPDVVRAITEDSTVLTTFASSLVREMSPAETGLYLDLQESPAAELPNLIAFIRAVSRAMRATQRAPIGVIVPSGDTVSYPTVAIARSADVIVVRLQGEHGPRTAPGPYVTPDFIRREIGARAVGLGAGRLVAALPLYGFVWMRDGSVRRISFGEASRLVTREGLALRRDPPSQFLTASGRDGWTVWVPDSRTIQFLIDAARSRGITKIALTGAAGADPALLRANAVRR